MNVADWLCNLGMGRYTAAFHADDITVEILRYLTADDLKDLGVASIGHRRVLLRAIAAMRASAPFDEPGYPKMHFIEHRYSHDATNWWVPNRACSEAMLRSAGFSIEAQPEEEVYLCRTHPIQVPADGPHAIYPQR